MKNLITLIFCFFSLTFLHSQEIPQLKLTKDGVQPVSIKIDNFSAEKIYDETLIWVHANYLTPKDALKENIENSKLKVEGFKRKAWWYKSMGIKNYNHMIYTIEILVKNGSFDFNYEVGDFFMDEGNSAQYDYRMFFKKDGSVRKQYIDAVTSLEYTMNELLISLYNSITNQSIQQHKKDLNKYLNTLQTSILEDSTNPKTHFELACFYSLIENRDKSYQHLSEAVKYGFNNKKKIQEEQDLKWLRHQPDFKEFVANNYQFEVKPAVKKQNSSNYIEELKELAKLKEQGVITEKEFNDLKEKIINRVKNE